MTSEPPDFVDPGSTKHAADRLRRTPDTVDPGSTKHAADRLRRTPDYGPSGYLPPRAAKRARKIMLREPLGLQWAIAAVIAGLLVLAAGGVLVLRMSGPPGAPFVTAGRLSAVDPRGAKVVSTAAGADVLVLRATGGVAVFAAPGHPVAWCAQSRRLESADGVVWDPDGRLVGGQGQSLSRLPAEVHDGVVYVDPTAGRGRDTGLRRVDPSRCGCIRATIVAATHP